MGRVFDKVIECNETNDVVVWKDDNELYAPPLKLIVKDSQTAAFALNGQVLDTFGAGKHELDLPQIPLLLAALGISNERANSFRADVFFFNLAQLYGIKWGTRSRIEYVDPIYNIPVSIGALGSFSIAVDRPRDLLREFVGAASRVTKEDFANYARSQLQMNVKALMMRYIKEQCICVYDLEMHLPELSSRVGDCLKPIFARVGIALTDFIVEDISLPDGERFFEQFKSRHFDASRQNVAYYDERAGADSCIGQPSVFDTAPQKKPHHSFCPYCGHAFTPSEKFCPVCGDERD